MTKRIKIFAGMAAIALALPLALAGTASAKSSFATAFSTKYGFSISCTYCHPGGNTSQFNSYGSDFRDAYLASGNATNAFTAIEPLDSDGDSFTNIDEITARTLPYDAASVPVVAPPTCTDIDQDGFSPSGGTCGAVDPNDNDASVIPKFVGVTKGGAWYVDTNGNGLWDSGTDAQFLYGGDASDVPLFGDWNGDGVPTPGVKRGNTYYLRNSNTSGVADVAFTFGDPADVPVVGDWNGDGTDTIGVKRGNVFYLRNSNTSGVADATFTYGAPTDVPVAGDWNGDGIDTIGVKRANNFYLRNSNTSGVADLVFMFGLETDMAVVGDWDNDGVDTVGVYRPTDGNFYLKQSHAGGNADMMRMFANPGGLPLSGR
jgi:hypothetical protein